MQKKVWKFVVEEEGKKNQRRNIVHETKMEIPQTHLYKRQGRRADAAIVSGKHMVFGPNPNCAQPPYVIAAALAP